MNDPQFPLVIIGASTRAAAGSALRAGYQPICLDSFADADLEQVATVQRIDPYPEGLPEALEALPECPLIYVGGIENHPEVVDAAERLHRLLGNPSPVVARVRCPVQLSQDLRLMRTGVPAWRGSDAPPAADGRWMIKPLASAGGKGVHVWDDRATSTETLDRAHGFQQRIEGTPYSAVFLATSMVGDIRFVGITQQVIGESACRANAFTWCGNIGPVSLSVAAEQQVRRMGNMLKALCGLTGLFGVDFVVDENDVPWITEVNPRYPASTELLEFATGQNLIPLHALCYDPETIVPQSAWEPPPIAHVLGKLVLYARRDFIVSEQLPTSPAAPKDWPELADIPRVGTTLSAGEPVCTVFAQAETVAECRRQLTEKLAEVEAALLS